MEPKSHTRVIVDSYNVPNGGALNVLGRFNHVSSTEIDLERVLKIKLERTVDQIEPMSDGFCLQKTN